MDLCGHATLATSFVLFDFYEPDAERIVFHTTTSGDLIEIDFPRFALNEVPVADEMEAAGYALLNFSFGFLQRGHFQSSGRFSNATPSCSAGSYT